MSRKLSLALLVTGVLAHGATAQLGWPTNGEPAVPPGHSFKAPVRLEAAGKVVRVESPGYASPCWTDVDGDGKKDLVVGQFHGGKMKFYKNLGDRKLAAGEWLEAEGEVAQVPGVW